MSKDKEMRLLLKEAHDHGYGIGRSNLDWSQEKSWQEFLKQNNMPIQSKLEWNSERAKKAIQLKDQGYSLRSIGSLLGLPHPQSVKNLIDRYGNLAIDKETLKG